LVDVRLARDAHGHELVSDGNGNRVLIGAVQNDRVSGRNFYIEYLHIFLVEGEMVAGLLIHRDDVRSFRKKVQR
jgi:hypothetical protein